MKPKRLVYLILSALVVCFAACKKDKKAPRQADCHLPYCRYLLLDYESTVEIPHAAALSPATGITIEGWVRLDNYVAGNFLIYKKSHNKAGGYYIKVSQKEGNGQLVSYIGGKPVKASAAFPIHTWTHWAVTSDGIHRRHYINGKLTGEFSEVAEAFTPCGEPLFLGKNMAANSGLAEFRLWSIARTAAQIKATMNEAITTSMPGLVAVWPLGKTADDSIESHHGILHNDPKFNVWSN